MFTPFQPTHGKGAAARWLAGAALALAPALALSQKVTLPSAATEKALRSLKMAAPNKNDGLETKEYSPEWASLPASAPAGLSMNAQGKSTLPLLVSNTMLIQFHPNAGKAGIDKYIKDRNLKVIETFPSLGAIKVQTDLSKYFAADLNDKDQNATLLRGANAAIKDFTKDPIVRSAAPDLVLNKLSAKAFTAPNFMRASEIGALATAGGGQTVDWGIGSVEADKLWKEPRTQDGALIGILDVGFTRHKDLVFIDLPDPTPVEDHGTHVAGIACARGAGVKGVLPSCFIRARTGDVFFTSANGNNVTQFIAVFSQILGTLDKFISEYDDMRVINVSMGYNWRPNFNINPDAPESGQWRALVEQQGLMLMTALERADKADKVIYSAAGNDSYGLGNPIQAKYASALNWAAITAREKQIAFNGVVVEAHDSSHKRASFSNVGGHISCPGVDVISTVAHDPTGVTSSEMYGKMSGTSMASPYCASAHLLFRLVRPGYSGREIARCLMTSNQKTDAGTPALKLTDALKACPERLPKKK